MRVKTRLALVYGFVIGVVIFYGVFVGYSINRINHLNDAKKVVLSLNYNASIMEVSKLNYLLNKERYEANRVYILLGTIEAALNELVLTNIHEEDLSEVEVIKGGLIAYEDTFSKMIAQTNQYLAFSVELEANIDEMNLLIGELSQNEQLDIVNLSRELNLELIEFYTEYLRFIGGESYGVEVLETRINNMKTMLEQLNEKEDVVVEILIHGQRIKSDADHTLESVEKLVLIKEALGLTNIQLSKQSFDIKQSFESISQNQNELIAREEKRILVLISLLLLSLLATLVTLLGLTFRSVVKNLAELMSTTEKITKGEYKAKIDTIKNDEFGDLASSINQMAQALDMSHQRNMEANENLEYLVKKRTQELQETKLDLEIINDKLQSEKERLVTIASTDDLTGLYNRRAILKALDEEIKMFVRYQHAFTIMIVDLDFFKTINDEYGHIAGDEVLRKIAKVFIASVRDVDVVGRFGGEEFLFVFKNTVIDDAKYLIERIREATKKLEYSFADVTLTFSAGVVQYQDETGVELLKKADKKLYEAKENGRNLILYG